MNAFQFLSARPGHISDVCASLQAQPGGAPFRRSDALLANPDWRSARREDICLNSSHPLKQYYEDFVRFPLCWLKRNGNDWQIKRSILDIAKLSALYSSRTPCAVSPSWSSTWGVFDIDTRSKYHPNQQGWSSIEKICSVLDGSYAKMFWILRSSVSGGLHIWFPIGEEVPSDCLSVYLVSVAACANLRISPGVLEIFPSVRLSESGDHNHIRIPLLGADSSVLFTSCHHSRGDISLLEFSEHWRDAKKNIDDGLHDSIAGIDADRFVYPGKSVIESLASRGMWK